MIRIAPEGWPFVLPGLVLTGALVAIALLLPVDSPGIRSGLWWTAGALGLLTGFVVFFFRDPERKAPSGHGMVLAPADGRIVQIVQEGSDPSFLGPATRISIFLSIFNVHIQRAPLSGRVEFRDYQQGSFAMAWKGKASEENEQATLGLRAGDHRIVVRQIAGWVARRIVTDPEEGSHVVRGQRIGLIRFGSRVDLLIPRDWKLLCQVGDVARGGLTPLAQLPGAENGRSP